MKYFFIFKLLLLNQFFVVNISLLYQTNFQTCDQEVK